MIFHSYVFVMIKSRKSKALGVFFIDGGRDMAYLKKFVRTSLSLLSFSLTESEKCFGKIRGVNEKFNLILKLI